MDYHIQKHSWSLDQAKLPPLPRKMNDIYNFSLVGKAFDSVWKIPPLKTSGISFLFCKTRLIYGVKRVLHFDLQLTIFQLMLPVPNQNPQTFKLAIDWYKRFLTPNIKKIYDIQSDLMHRNHPKHSHFWYCWFRYIIWQGGRTWQAISAGANMAMKPLAKRAITIFATNALFLRVISNFRI